MNSDGRRLFEEYARLIVYEHPEYKRVIGRARRDPVFENVVRAALIVLDRAEVEEIIDTVINGPYTYRVPRGSYRYS